MVRSGSQRSRSVSSCSTASVVEVSSTRPADLQARFEVDTAERAMHTSKGMGFATSGHGPIPLPSHRGATTQMSASVTCFLSSMRRQSLLPLRTVGAGRALWLIRFQLRNGLGVMPRFTSEQIPPDELILYI